MPAPATILVVDDTPALLDLVRECLEEAGYRVITCLQSTDAVALARESCPHAVMLDIVMPVMSGWEVLAEMRRVPELAQTPVIVCTAYVAEALGRLAELRGPSGDGLVGLLPKPFDPEELLDVAASVTGATVTS